MWYGKFSDRYNGKRKKKPVYKGPIREKTYTDDKGQIKKNRFNNFIRNVFRGRVKV